MKYLLPLFMLVSIVSINAMDENKNLSLSESESFQSVESNCNQAKSFVTTTMASASEKATEAIDTAKEATKNAVTKAEGKLSKFGNSVKAKFNSLRGKTPKFASLKTSVKNGAHNTLQKIKNNPGKAAVVAVAAVATVAAVVFCVKKYKEKKAKVA